MSNYPAFVLKHLTVKVRSGMEWQCLCPYHEDTSPSFSINVRKGLFVCYACGAKGNMDDLAKHLKVKGVVADDPTVDELEEKIVDLLAEVQKDKPVYAEHWESRFRIGPMYETKWRERIPHISTATLDLFTLGYDNPRDELIIPIFDWNGSASSCVRRRLGEFDGPKYLYARGFKTSQVLFGAWQARTFVRDNRRVARVAIVEGSIDAISLWGNDIPAVALLGSNLSAVQRRLLLKLDALEYVIMTDNDTAGKKAALQVEQAMKGSGSIITRPKAWPPFKKDPGEMTREEQHAVFFDQPIPAPQQFVLTINLPTKGKGNDSPAVIGKKIGTQIKKKIEKAQWIEDTYGAAKH